MNRKEQRTLLGELRDVMDKMSREDVDDFRMFLKREKDDEELDLIAQRRLEQLHGKYVVKKSLKDIDALLRKYSRQADDFGPDRSDR